MRGRQKKKQKKDRKSARAHELHGENILSYNTTHFFTLDGKKKKGRSKTSFEGKGNPRLMKLPSGHYICLGEKKNKAKDLDGESTGHRASIIQGNGLEPAFNLLRGEMREENNALRVSQREGVASRSEG